MDPNSGKLYESAEAAVRDGVQNPVQITGRDEDLQRISKAVMHLYNEEQKFAKKAQKHKRKVAKASRRNNRG